ncbi:MAG: asparagine synthetase B [bacterium]|nr:asparagine synthetase B [bacterium]
MTKKLITLSSIILLLFIPERILASSGKILIPMDEVQTDHLRAYGLAYWCLDKAGLNVEWLLNFRGGSFMVDETPRIIERAIVLGVSYQTIDFSAANRIYSRIEEENMEVILLEKAPKIAVYTPPGKEPWDDAVTLALNYAEIPYDTLWDKEVLRGELVKYDWLHLHHEDFTGQYGKFYAAYRHAAWYQQGMLESEHSAREAGYNSVPEYKAAVARAIRDYVYDGGFLFAMCSATDTIDIALAAEGIDIVPPEFDHDPVDLGAQQKLDFSKTFAFTDFTLEMNPMVYEHSDIDISDYDKAMGAVYDAFTLFEFSAKYDPIPTMLTQNHTFLVKGFMGQTTFFNRPTIKPEVTILGDIQKTAKVKYIHGSKGKGTFTFLAGHDPEDYKHAVGDPPTRLDLHKNSPGYRLILNNILFPAAKPKKQKT